MADIMTVYASDRDNIRTKMVDNNDGSYSPAVVLTGRKVKVTRVTINRTESVAASSSETVTILPTSGYYISKILSIRLEVPAIAGSTGTHRLRVGYTPVPNHPIFELDIQSTSRLRFRNTAEVEGTLKPTGSLNYEVAASSDVPLAVYYYNNSNTNQSGTRNYEIILLEEALA